MDTWIEWKQAVEANNRKHSAKNTDASYESGSLAKWMRDGNKAEDWFKRDTIAANNYDWRRRDVVVSEPKPYTPDPRGESRLY